MGTERRLIIIDEFDWNYREYSREKAVKDLEGLREHFKVLTSIDNLIILDIQKTPVENVIAMMYSKNLPYDGIYIQKDNEPTLESIR